MTGRWTRESIDAHVRDHIVGDRVYEQIVDDLLADRDLALQDRTATSTWRLTDKFGGHEVEIADPDVEVHNSSHVSIRIVGEPNSWQVGDWPTEWLVEVRPPSIEDPVALPLLIEDSYRDGIRITARLDDETPVEIERVGSNGPVGAPVYLTVAQARNVARALWQRANAVERVTSTVAGPDSREAT